MDKLEDTILPEGRTGLWLATCFYEQKTIRNLLLKKFGHRFSESMADVFMGDKVYPRNIKKKIKEKIKQLVLK